MKALLTIKKTMELSVKNLIIFIQNIFISYLTTLSDESFIGIIYPIYLKKDFFMHLLVLLFLLLFSIRSTFFIKYAIVVKENEILKLIKCFHLPQFCCLKMISIITLTYYRRALERDLVRFSRFAAKCLI